MKTGVGAVVGDSKSETVLIFWLSEREGPPGFFEVWIKLAFVLPKEKGSADRKEEAEEDDEIFFRKKGVHLFR